MRGPVGSEPPGFRHAPFMLLLVVESLAPMPRGVKPPVRLPGDCLHERWQLEQNQPFLFQGDGWHLESSRAPPPCPSTHSVCTPGRDTRAPHPTPPLPMTGPPTAQTTLPGPPPGTPTGSLHIRAGALDGEKEAAGGGTI